MNSRHKLIHLISLLAIVVNMLMPLGAPLVTAQDIVDTSDTTITSDQTGTEVDTGAAAVIDDDQDGIDDAVDNCLGVANDGQSDIDGDGIGDACDPVNDLDLDADLINNDVDNCSAVANGDQADIDGDGIGNACDPVNDLDLDGDLVNNDVDNCPAVANGNQSDLDGDGIGDACDPLNDLDRDSDGVNNDVDNCPDVANSDQADVDGDGVGNPCDSVNDLDRDGDGITNDLDNCPDVSNSDQADLDGDGVGNPCDSVNDTDSDGDGLADDVDACPAVKPVKDADKDGCEDKEAPKPTATTAPTEAPKPTATAAPTQAPSLRTSAASVTAMGTAANPTSVTQLTFRGGFSPSGPWQSSQMPPGAITCGVPIYHQSTFAVATPGFYTFTLSYDPGTDYGFAPPAFHSISGATLVSANTTSGGNIVIVVEATTAGNVEVITKSTLQCRTTNKYTGNVQAGVVVGSGTQSIPIRGGDIVLTVVTLGTPQPSLSQCVNGTATNPSLAAPANTSQVTYSAVTVTQSGNNFTFTYTATVTPGHIMPVQANMPANYTRLSDTQARYSITYAKVQCQTSTVPTLTSQNAVCRDLPTYTFTAGTGFTINSVTVNGTAATTTPGTYTINPPQGTNTVTMQVTLINGYALPDMTGWTLVSGNTYTKTVNPTHRVCTQAVVPGISFDAFVCTAGVTTGANTFTVEELTGMTLVSVNLNGELVSTTAGTWDLPATNGTYTITVRATLNPDALPPAGYTPDAQGVYTFTQQVTVDSCDPSTVPTIVDIDPFVCVAGETDGANTFSVTMGTGFENIQVFVDGVAATETATAGTYELPAGDGTYDITVTFTLINGYEAPAGLTPENGVYTISALDVVVDNCEPSTLPTIVDIDPFVCVAGETDGANTFSVTMGTGFENIQVFVDGVAATETATAGTYELPAGNGTYEITVTFTLINGYEAPAGLTPENGVYTISALDVEVDNCETSTVPTIVDIDPFVCVAGETDGANTFSVTMGTGFENIQVFVDGVAATETATAGTYELPAGDGTYDITVTFTLINGYEAPAGLTPENGVYTISALDVVVDNCEPSTLRLPIISLSVCLDGDATLPSMTGPVAQDGDGIVYSAVGYSIDANGDYIFTFSATAQTGFTLPATFPTSPDGAYVADPIGSKTVARFTSNPIEVADCDPEVTILKEVSGGSGPEGEFLVGDTIVFTITITNTGDGDVEAPGVSFADTIDPALVGLGWTPGGDYDLNNCEFNNGSELRCKSLFLDEAGGENDTFTVTLTSGEITETNPVCGSYTNTAEFSEGFVGVEPGFSTVAFEIDCDPAYSIDKESAVTTDTNPSGLSIGDTITYTIVISNTGNEELTGLLLNDVFEGDGSLAWVTPADGNTIPTIPVGGSTTLTATYVVLQADVNAGEITNCAYISNEGLRDDTVQGENCVTDPITQVSGIDVGKTAIGPGLGLNMGVVAPADRADAGDTITFNITVRNSGNTTRTDDVVVTDGVAVGTGTVEFGIANGGTITTAGNVITVTSDIAPNGVVTIPVTYTLTQDDIDRGSVQNCAVYSPQVGQDTDCATVTIPRTPSFTFTKDGPTAPVLPGESIQFTVRFTNTGNVTVASATIADPLPALPSGSWDVALVGDSESVAAFPYEVTNLAPGESVILVATAVVPAQIETPNTTWCKQWDNTATVTGTFANQAPISDTDSASAQVNCTSLQIAKSGPATATPGGAVNYSLLVENLGNTTVYGVTVTDTLDDRLVLVSASGSGWICTPVGQEVTCTLASLLPGTSATIDIETTVIERPTVEQCDQNIPNSATISSFTLTEMTMMRLTGEITPPGTQITSNPVSTDILCAPDVSFGKVGPEGIVQPGSPIVFTVTVKNDGTYPAADLLLTDNLPASLAGLTWEISTNDPAASCERIGDSISCTNIDLDAYGDSFVLTLTAQTTAEAPVCGTYTNQAGPSNGSRADLVSDTVTIACAPKVEASKTTATTNVTEDGVVINYTIRVENTGNQVLANLAVNDSLVAGIVPGSVTWAPMPDGVTLIGNVPTITSLGINQVVTLTASYTVSQSDIDLGGPIVNCITVANDQTQTDNCPRTTITRTPEITIVKEASATTVDPGGTLTYTLKVENTGNVTVVALNVTDLVPPGLTPTNVVADAGLLCIPIGPVVNCLGGVLLPDQIATITITASVTATPTALVCANGFTNIGTATAASLAGPTSDTSNEVRTALNCQPAPDMLKVSNVETTTPGGEVTWTITAWNTGTLDTTVTITDTLPTGFDLTSDLPAGCSEDGQVITCTGVVLPTQTSEATPAFTLTLTGTVANDGLTCGEITNSASFPFGDETIVRTDSVDVQCRPGFSLDKDVNRSSVRREGTVLIYTVYVWNSGNTDLAPFTFEDTFSHGLTNLSGPTNVIGSGTVTRDGTTGVFTVSGLDEGETFSFEMRYTVTQADLDSGETIKNCVIGGERVSASNCPTTTITQEPGIDLEKTSVVDMTVVEPADRVDAGDTITYTITVDNTGNVTLYNVQVNDPRVGLSETIAELAPDAAPVEFTVTYVVTQDDLDLGNVYNCADTTGEPPLFQQPEAGFTAQVVDPTAPVSDEDCITTDLPESPSIDIEKTGSVLMNIVGPEDRVDAGDQIEYTITVENTGNVTLTNVVVNDPLVGFSETIESLAPGEPQNFTVTYTVTLADLNAGTVQNCADVTGDGPMLPALSFAAMQEAEVPYVSDQDCIDTPLENVPGIDIEKTSVVDMTIVEPVDRVDEGDTITYTITVENTGNVTLYNVVVNDPRVGLSETIAELAPDAAPVEFTVTYVVTQVDLDAGDVQNCADVTGTPPFIDIIEDRVAVAITGDEPMPTTLFDEDCVTTDLEREPGVDIEKTGSVLMNVVGPADRVDAGDTIEYTITVENTGNVTLENVLVNDPLVDFSETIASLAPGATESFTVTYVVTQADLDAGNVENCADLSGDEDAETALSAEDCVTTDTPGDSGVELEKTGTAATGDDDVLNLGEVITYTFAVTNTGNVTLDQVTINDPMEGLTWTDGTTIASLAPGETVELTATYTVSQADVDEGTVVNCADLSGTAADDSTVTDDDCDTQVIDQNPAILVALVCPGPSGALLPDVGEEVTFEFTISNNGDLTVSNIGITTSREGELDSPFPTTLEPGESETRKFTIVVTQAEYDAREITLEVSAEGTLPDGTSAKLASMVMMQTVGDSVESTLSLECPMEKLPTPKPTPKPVMTPKPVTNLPNTGSGDIAASGTIIWAAAITMIAFGAGALGIRRKYQ